MTDQINSTRESFVKLRLSTNSQTQTLNYLNQHYEREKENPICGQKVGQDPEDDSQILAHTSIWFVEPEHFKKYDPNHKGYTKEIVLNHNLSAIKTLPADAEKFIFQYGGKPIDLLALNLKWGHRDFTDESTGVEVDDKAKKISLCMKKTERMRMIVSDWKNKITHILQGKNYKKLIELESNIEIKLAGDKPIDPEYWESLLVQLNVWKAKAKLKGMRRSIDEKDVFQEKFVITEVKKLKQEKNRRDEILTGVQSKDLGIGTALMDEVWSGEKSPDPNKKEDLQDDINCFRQRTVGGVRSKSNQKSIVEEFKRE
ncbi:mid region of cactin-domain-containing protein [Phakopsora pachyrhizi]|uniref:Mid region of cactin-domain-containing protein n=1 Tax=Phakopsora pachyrhizi TaxID=170000 RepID=A0AAV0BFD8_PHAPC|nr:mid region of cactin-domain-containing protein [Phakopsora pachyrhizi]